MSFNAPNTASILCVDEGETGLYFRRLVLERHGYRVLTAATAQSALEIFLQKDVDLVVSDIYLGRDSGPTLAAEIKRIRPNIPVLLLTGAMDTNIPVSGDCIDKTARPSEFLQRVKV